MTTHLIDKAMDAGAGQQERRMKASAETRLQHDERQPSNERLVRQIRAEFLEMPGLCLTIAQAQRLWSLESRRCEALLKSLIDSRFLRRTDRGLFVLRRP